MKKYMIGLGILMLFLFAQDIEKEAVMKPSIVNLEKMTIVGLQTLTTLEHNVIPNLWDRMMPRCKEIKNIANHEATLGISFGFEEIPMVEGKNIKIFFHMAGFIVNSVEDLPEGMTYKNIPAHMYAKFTHKGSLSKLMDTYNYIYGQWLPQSGFLYDTEAIEIEWYDERFKGRDDEKSEFDILVPIIKKTDK